MAKLAPISDRIGPVVALLTTAAVQEPWSTQAEISISACFGLNFSNPGLSEGCPEAVVMKFVSSFLLNGVRNRVVMSS